MNVLPLKDAYRFGEQHGLQHEIEAIRGMVIEWDLSYTSSLRRGYIIALFTEKKLFDAFKKECWPAGDTDWGRRKTKFWLRIKLRYADFLDGRIDPNIDEDDEAEEQAFAAEADLRDFLAKNLGCVEAGLQLYQKGEQSGVEFAVADGRIDVLAVDSAGRFVVFELKLGRGRNKTLGQLLYYMAWVDQHLGQAPCRGLIVAKEITKDLILAAKRAHGVSLLRYKLSVSVEKIS